MTNVLPFPKRPAPKKAKLNHANMSREFLLPDLDGNPVDVLMMIIQAGSTYLTSSDEYLVDELPTTQMLLTIDGMDRLIDASNILLMRANRHAEDFAPASVDQMIHRGKLARKVIHKLYDMLPSNEFIVTMDSFGPDLMAEYATNAAMLVATQFALDIMACYYYPFIKTGKDRRKIMFRYFQGAYLDARDECLSRSEGHEFLIKELSSAHRAVQKVLREL